MSRFSFIAPKAPLEGLVLLETLRVVLKEQAKGGHAKQKGLEEPQKASGWAADPLVAVKDQEGRVRV